MLSIRNPAFLGGLGSVLVEFDFLVVAGGGSGAARSNANRSIGGGGAGGFRTSVGTSGEGASAESAVILPRGSSFTVTLGAGGAGVSVISTGANGLQGNDSVCSTVTSL